jgi:hypothetical protein
MKIANVKTAIKKVRVECTDLSVGMYVCDLDRPWLDSPFLIQGFYIKDNLDINTVRDMCAYVHVDKVVARDLLTSNLPTASSALLSAATVSPPVDTSSSVVVDRASEAQQPIQSARREQELDDFFPDRELIKYTEAATWRNLARRGAESQGRYCSTL